MYDTLRCFSLEIIIYIELVMFDTLHGCDAHMDLADFFVILYHLCCDLHLLASQKESDGKINQKAAIWGLENFSRTPC